MIRGVSFSSIFTATGMAKLGQIVVGDLTMAGDNVVIMGSLASGLPERDRKRVLMLGVGMAVGVAPAGEAQAFQSIWLVLHVIFALVGYVGLTVAFAAGLMYLMQFRELKSKHFGAIFRFFPPLETLDRLGRLGDRQLLVAGHLDEGVVEGVGGVDGVHHLLRRPPALRRALLEDAE